MNERTKCGLCGEVVSGQDLARGRRLAICRACTTDGITSTLHSTAVARDGETNPRAYLVCSMCGEATPEAALYVRGVNDARRTCTTCLHESYATLVELLELGGRRQALSPSRENAAARAMLERHFGGLAPTEVVTSARTFAYYLRADLQRAADELFRGSPCVGLHREYSFASLTFASILAHKSEPVTIAPLQFAEVDVGEGEPVRCVGEALYLLREGDTPGAVVVCPEVEHGQTKGLRIEVAVPVGEAGQALARRLLADLEAAVQASASYRGKVISLECQQSHRGMAAGAVVVHKLASVVRDDLILPARTLDLLDRNVFEFAEQRERLLALGMPVKKGLLFYGPPGTGKTHTIRYIAGRLPKHTTLLITAREIGALGTYMALARLLSPAIVVIEDVDLIARHREDLQSPEQEVLLNRLLNEMDGLRENQEVLFVLTTNRPDMLESALAGRPGRIDQAIEFPLPDEDGRARLVELYRHGLELTEDLRVRIVQRTEGVSASFVKELMRRAAQFALRRDPSTARTEVTDVDQALAEMLFDGGKLNATLLGARAAAAVASG
jgi:hypothetical protein